MTLLNAAGILCVITYGLGTLTRRVAPAHAPVTRSAVARCDGHSYHHTYFPFVVLADTSAPINLWLGLILFGIVICTTMMGYLNVRLSPCSWCCCCATMY